MNKLTLSLFIFIFSLQAFGQNGRFDLRAKLHSLDCTTNTLEVDLEIRADAPTTHFNVSDINIRFDFGSALANPTMVQELGLSGFVSTTNPVTNSFYSAHTLVGTSGDIVSYNVSLSGGDGYPLDDINYTPVGRVSFNIVDDNQPIELNFRSDLAGDFPSTFIGEKFNSVLYIADEGSYNNYIQNIYCIANSSPTATNDTGTGTPGTTEQYCVLSNDTDPETAIDISTLSIISGPTTAEGTATIDAVGCIEYTPAAGYSGTTSITYEICDDGNQIPSTLGANNPVPHSIPNPLTPGIPTTTPLCTNGTLDVTVSSGGLKVSPKLFLEGPYDASAGEMTTGVNDDGLLPTTEPYTALGVHNGTETTTTQILTNNSIVDWVLVELRDATNPATIVATRAALLDNQGNVTDTDGVSPVDFIISGGNYYVSVVHRNHLGIMVANAVALSPMNTVIDFTTETLYGLDPTKDVSGVQVMWGGDSDLNFSVNAADRSDAWNDRNLPLYLGTDMTLDGVVNAADRSLCWNNRNLTAQLP